VAAFHMPSCLKFSYASVNPSIREIIVRAVIFDDKGIAFVKHIPTNRAVHTAIQRSNELRCINYSVRAT